MQYQALAIDCILEEQFRLRDLLSAELEFMRLIHMGIVDGREGFNCLAVVSIRLMRFLVVRAMRLWAM